MAGKGSAIEILCGKFDTSVELTTIDGLERGIELPLTLSDSYNKAGATVHSFKRLSLKIGHENQYQQFLCLNNKSLKVIF